MRTPFNPVKSSLYFAVILFSGLLISCSGHKNGLGAREVDITFSASPIDLKGVNARFAQDIPYGPDPENTFDIFLPQSDTPTPLVIYIHGGGFLGGDKNFVYSVQKNGLWDFPDDIRTFLNYKIAYATINYRLLDKNDSTGVLKSLGDSKRCLQYVRYIARDLNIDPTDIVIYGNSAGAGTSLWLATRNDMADPDNTDPVLQQSTRLKGVALRETQASYDLERYQTDIFAYYNFNLQAFFTSSPDLEQRFTSFYGISQPSQFYSDSIIAYRHKVDMLGLISSDDPEIWAKNMGPVVEPTNIGILNHHPYHVRAIKEYADQAGIPIVAYYGTYADSSGEGLVDFLLRKLR